MGNLVEIETQYEHLSSRTCRFLCSIQYVYIMLVAYASGCVRVYLYKGSTSESPRWGTAVSYVCIQVEILWNPLDCGRHWPSLNASSLCSGHKELCRSLSLPCFRKTKRKWPRRAMGLRYTKVYAFWVPDNTQARTNAIHVPDIIKV